MLIVIAVVFASLGAFSVQFIALDLLAKTLPFVMIGLGILTSYSRQKSASKTAPTLSASLASTPLAHWLVSMADLWAWGLAHLS